jgi:signal peptidase II
VLARFSLYESIPVVPGFFHLTYVRNPGAAVGLFAGRAESFRKPFFLLVTLVALGGILLAVRKLSAQRRWMLASLALIFGGAAGNLVDRVRWGEVVDFLDVFWRSYHWPAFNVADSAITVGIVMLLAEELLPKRHP